MGDRTYTEALADFVTLAYHEARNVRHLISKGHLTGDKWKRLRNLPKNRIEAWRQLQPLRQRARASRATFEIFSLFQSEFNVSLAELIQLYANPNWRHSLIGGNAWEKIVKEIEDLGHTIEGGQGGDIAESVSEILQLRHNTGTIKEKLVKLDRCLAQEDQ